MIHLPLLLMAPGVKQAWMAVEKGACCPVSSGTEAPQVSYLTSVPVQLVTLPNLSEPQHPHHKMRIIVTVDNHGKVARNGNKSTLTSGASHIQAAQEHASSLLCSLRQKGKICHVSAGMIFSPSMPPCSL